MNAALYLYHRKRKKEETMKMKRNILQMRKLIGLVTVVVILSFGQSAEAQQLPVLSQYLFNGFLVNPGYAGLDGLSAVTATAREQWLGLPNSPKTHIVSFQTRVLKNSFVRKGSSARRRMMNRYTSGRVGLGGYIYNDKTGILDRTGLQLCYAYHIPMGKKVLSFALSGSLYQFSINRQKIQEETNSDKLIDGKSLNMIIPDVGIGAVYSAQDYYAGLSISNLLQSYAKLGYKIDSNLKTYRQANITLGYRYEIDRERTLEPSILLKTTSQLTTQIDITTKLHLRDYWGGLSYRSGNAIVLMGGVRVDKFSFGYAFDYNLNAINRVSFGSHEIMVAYKFGDTASRMRWLNR